MRRIEAKSPWVEKWSYSRAVRRGAIIEVGGTTAMGSDGDIVGVGDPYGQARHVLGTVIGVVEELGGSREDIVRTRVFVRNVSDWEPIGRAHSELFGELLPASSCIGGLDFLAPDLLLEVEATAIVAEG